MDIFEELEGHVDRSTKTKPANQDALSVLADFDRDFDILDTEMDAAQEIKKVGDWEFVAELLNIFRMLNSSLRLETVLEHVIDAAIKVTKAQRGFIVLRGENGEMEFKIARDASRNALADDQFEISKSIVKRALDSRQIVYLNDVMAAGDYTPSDSVAELNLRSVVCAPLITDGKVLGAIYTDSNQPLIGRSRVKEQIFKIFADQASLAIRNSQLYQDLQKSFEQVSQAQESLIFAERMATRGKLAARIGHEMNNLLAAMYGNLELTHKSLLGGANVDVVQDRLVKVMRMCEGMGRFTQGLMSGVQTTPNPILCDLNEIVKDFVTFSHPLFNKTGAKIIMDLDSELPRINADKDQLQQVLYNAVSNSIEAKGDATVTIHTRHLFREGKVALAIADNGPGIEKDKLEEIFEPQITTKEDGHGFGLGVCKEIVKRNGGTIKMESEIGEGARLIMKFPVPSSDAPY